VNAAQDRHANEKTSPTLRKSRWRRLLPWGLGLGLLTAGAVIVHQHWHQRAYYYFSTQAHDADVAGRNVWLPGYRVTIDGKPVKGIDSDLSAIAYDYDHDRLVGVTNAGAMRVVVISKTGELLAEYPIHGFEDVEGIAYMGDGLVAVADERLQQLDIFRLPEQPGQSIEAKDVQFIALDLAPNVHNKGFEGVTYDPLGDRLFVAKERDPMQLLEVSGVRASLAGGKLQVKVKNLTPWLDKRFFGTDISDLHYDTKTGHLLVLSEESRLIVEFDDQGQVVSFRTLLGGAFGELKQNTPQAEGLTMDAEGNLYVVSEPNLFYRFETR